MKNFKNNIGENPQKKVNKFWGTYYPKNVSFNKKYEFFFEKFKETDHNIIVYTDAKNGNKISGYLKMIYFYNDKENKQSEYNSKRNDLLEKYKHLADCADPLSSENEFSVTYGNKNIMITSRILESTNYQIYISVGKKL